MPCESPAIAAHHWEPPADPKRGPGAWPWSCPVPASISHSMAGPLPDMAQTQTDEPGLFCGCRFFGFFFLRPSVMVSQCHLPSCRRRRSNPRPRVSQHKRASDKRARERTRNKPKPQGEQALDLDVVGGGLFFFLFFFCSRPSRLRVRFHLTPQ
ncbi:hypothetical protein CKAH01_12605 [Colletotrichum kahawae]|uniref:Uncharacterized protein n=1 Tax=Colletotrichum kahawae TaxID=34407 RepID=A0AAD9YS43_COLKA|nr:hypothetical protein CKAH01_12605 [Colletotrichum kahawae]